jgi:tetratricopeptide (TPR) repeat protein
VTVVSSIRAARTALALALISDERVPDAAHELHRALGEPGDDPPDWRIRFHLGECAQRLGDEPEAALAHFVAAAAGAPLDEAAAPAQAALRLLEDSASAPRAVGLDATQAAALNRRAQEPSAPAPLVQLALHLLLLRGDLGGARSLVDASASEAVQSDPALDTARAVTRARELIDRGAFTEALAALEEADVQADEPTAIGTRALALYGADRLDEALAAAGAAPPTFDTALVEALVWLTRAATGEEGAASEAITRAERAAGTAARMVPSLGDALLLRAQVALEGLEDLSGGRALLERAVRRLESEPERARHWRVQSFVRTDDRFRYMRLEVAAACGRADELLAVELSELPLLRTTYRQDAALAELLAAANGDAGRSQRAAALLDAAASTYDRLGEGELALAARRGASAAAPTADRLLRLAEDCWTAAYRREPAGPEAEEPLVAEGLNTLDRLDGDALATAAERVEAAYVRGLLLMRRGARMSATLSDRWRPLPWLLLAAIDKPEHSYRAEHLSRALLRAELGRPALDLAERALAARPDDEWIKEGVVIMHMSWSGLLDDRIAQIADEIGPADWAAAMHLADAVHRDDRAEAARWIDLPLHDAPWVREVYAVATARLYGLDRAAAAYRALQDEARDKDDLTAAEVALIFRDVDAARRLFRRGVARHAIGGPRRRLMEAMLRFVDGDDDALPALVEVLDATPRPYLLYEWGRRLFPSLRQAWAGRPRMVEGLERLEAHAARRAEALQDLPPVTAEMDLSGVTSLDRDLDQVVRALLVADAAGGLVDAGAMEDLRQALAGAQLPPGFHAATASMAMPSV